jgi:hypothetical protein
MSMRGNPQTSCDGEPDLHHTIPPLRERPDDIPLLVRRTGLLYCLGKLGILRPAGVTIS